MEIDFIGLFSTVINIVLIIGIIIGIYKGIKGIKNFINRIKSMDKKLDILLEKLDNENND